MQNKLFFILVLILVFGLTKASALEITPTPLPKVINGGVVNGKAISLPKPEYPAAALAVRASGEVKIQVTIDEQGNIISATAVSGHPLLRQAAEQAARNAAFKSTTLSGQPVKVTGVIIYNFVPAPMQEADKAEAPTWAFGMFLSFLKNSSSETIKELGDERGLSSILAEMAADIPLELAAEKSLFDKLAKAEGDERRTIAGELLSSIKKYFNESEKWQIETGEHLGNTMSELIKHKKKIAGGSAAINATTLKANLQKIKDSITVAPKEISPDLIKQFKNIAEFATAENLNSPETLDELLEEIEPLFNALSDE